MMSSKISKIISDSIRVKNLLLQDQEILRMVDDVITLITVTFNNGGKVLFCGNGGSAADAQHLAAEFSGRFYKDRKALPSEALHCNTSYLTAVGNDYGYEFVYSRLVEGLGHKGDVLIGLSTSGNSLNILNAIQKANEIGMKTIGMTGMGGGKMRGLTHYNIEVPSHDTPRIQECHIMLGHIICQYVEEGLFDQ